MERNESFPAVSFWHDSAKDFQETRNRLETDIHADVAIVGAGYTGLWTAYYLKKNNPALNIVIVEAETAGFGASGRNGGWCSAYLSGIHQWLDDPAWREDGVRLQRLMFNTVADVGQVTRAESIDCHFERSGGLEVAVLPQHMDRLQREIQQLRDLGFSEDDYRFLDAVQVRGKLNVDRALGGIHLSHCAAIHPARLALGLATTVERLGVSVFENSPVLSVNQGLLTTPHGTVKAEVVLVATEGYSDSIKGRARRLIPIHSRMVVTEPLDPDQLSEIGFKQRYCFGNLDRLVTYGQLTADNRIAFGCRGSYQFGSKIRTFHPQDPDFDLVCKTLLRFFPGLSGVAFTHAWGGCMGVTRSLRPAVSFDRNSGMGWAGGYFGNGVGAAHLAGQTLADLVAGHETDRVNTPWVNPPGKLQRWEPEPMRWLGIETRSRLMQWADQAEYRGSRLAPVYDKALEVLFP